MFINDIIALFLKMLNFSGIWFDMPWQTYLTISWDGPSRMELFFKNVLLKWTELNSE